MRKWPRKFVELTAAALVSAGILNGCTSVGLTHDEEALIRQDPLTRSVRNKAVAACVNALADFQRCRLGKATRPNYDRALGTFKDELRSLLLSDGKTATPGYEEIAQALLLARDSMTQLLAGGPKNEDTGWIRFELAAQALAEALQPHGFLGATISADRVRVNFQTHYDGVKIDNLVTDGPAAKAGLKSGDLILSFNGTRVMKAAPLLLLIEETPPGSSVLVEYVRSKKQAAVQMVIGNKELP